MNQWRISELFNSIYIYENELQVIPDSVSFGGPSITTLGAVTHTGGDLKGSLTFTSSALFNGRLSATVNGTLINATETFSATAGSNSLLFNFGNIGVANVIFTLHNLGVVSTTDFLPANVEPGSVIANAAISATLGGGDGFRLVVSGGDLASNAIIATFNVDAEAGIWNVVNNNPGPSTIGVRMIYSDLTNIASRGQTDQVTASEYTIGYGFENAKTGQISFIQSGGGMHDGVDLDLVFSPAKENAVDITDGEITIF